MDNTSDFDFNKNNIDNIIALVLSGRASEKEITILQEWIAKAPENEAVFNQLQNVWNEPSRTSNYTDANDLRDKIWNKGITKEGGRERKIDTSQKSWKYYLRFAAVIAFIITIPFLAREYFSSEETSEIEVITKLIHKENPKGQKSRIYLPDGSIVWLNSESSLVYPEVFMDSVRNVKLIGEAYFEVAHNKDKPFIVQSGDVFTKALGTSFNIRSYPEEEQQKISLLTGKVLVVSEVFEPVMLAPGKELSYKKGSDVPETIDFVEMDVLGWKDGVLIFDGDSFKEFKVKIESWYGVEVILKGTPDKNWQLRGRYDNENLENLLETLSFNKNFTFKITDNQVKLIFN